MTNCKALALLLIVGTSILAANSRTLTIVGPYDNTGHASNQGYGKGYETAPVKTAPYREVRNDAKPSGEVQRGSNAGSDAWSRASGAQDNKYGFKTGNGLNLDVRPSVAVSGSDRRNDNNGHSDNYGFSLRPALVVDNSPRQGSGLVRQQPVDNRVVVPFPVDHRADNRVVRPEPVDNRVVRQDPIDNPVVRSGPVENRPRENYNNNDHNGNYDNRVVPPPYVAPTYIPPAYVPPTYVPPTYVAPDYVAPPTYVPPINDQPTYVAPVYIPPVNDQPAYVAPSDVPSVNDQPVYIPPVNYQPVEVAPAPVASPSNFINFDGRYSLTLPQCNLQISSSAFTFRDCNTHEIPFSYVNSRFSFGSPRSSTNNCGYDRAAVFLRLLPRVTRHATRENYLDFFDDQDQHLFSAGFQQALSIPNRYFGNLNLGAYSAELPSYNVQVSNNQLWVQGCQNSPIAFQRNGDDIDFKKHDWNEKKKKKDDNKNDKKEDKKDNKKGNNKKDGRQGCSVDQEQIFGDAFQNSRRVRPQSEKKNQNKGYRFEDLKGNSLVSCQPAQWK